jgi:hypothetical protein
MFELVVHTVLVTPSKRGGLALGLDVEGKPFRVWLQTPRAVELAVNRLGKMMQITPVVKALHTDRDTERIDRLVSHRAKEYEIA